MTGRFLFFLFFFAFLTHTALLLGSKTGIRRTHRKAAPNHASAMPMPRQCHALPMHAARMHAKANQNPAKRVASLHSPCPKLNPEQRRVSVTTASGRGGASRQWPLGGGLQRGGLTMRLRRSCLHALSACLPACLPACADTCAKRDKKEFGVVIPLRRHRGCTPMVESYQTLAVDNNKNNNTGYLSPKHHSC